MRYSRSFVLKILGAALFLALLLWMGLGLRHPDNKSAPVAAPPSQNAGFDIVCRGVHHEAKRQGALEWALDAKKAAYSREKNTALLEQVAMDFFPKKGGKVHATANQADLDTATNDAKLSGSVVLAYAGYTLRASQMEYTHDKKLVACPVPVSIEGPHLRVSGNSMQCDLNKGETVLHGNITGYIYLNGTASKK